MMSALFVWLWLTGVPIATAACTLKQPGETRQVARIIDGDTVHLRPRTGTTDTIEKLRFIGIDTPERATDTRPAEALAQQARQFVTKQLARHHYQLLLEFDREHKDRYGRTLAHVWLDRQHNLAEILLENGLAVLLSTPPNLRNLDCYHDAEQRARNTRLGIWGLPGFRTTAAINITPGTGGYRIITGKVVSVSQSKKSIWLNLDGPVAIRIARSDLRYFNEPRLLNSRGNRVTVRGWTQPYRNKAVLRLRHPIFLERQYHDR